MTGTAQERSYFRYFDLADCFVQICALDEGALALHERPGLGRAGYRKLVIEACMPDFRDSLDERLEMLFPDDPLMVEDLLYQLCVEVNPALDIHEVRLTVDPRGATQPQTETTESDGAEAREALLEQLAERTRGLSAALRRDVIGQDAAIETVVQAVRSATAGLGEMRKPLASFLFTGRTGTGKTELARRLAKGVYGHGATSGLVRIDCSEFALAHEYSKLIGSPPGYIGHDEGGQLTDRVAESPESVVLFDEIEKAHPKVHNLLLQILEEGELTDGKGRRVPFDRSIVVLTSNCGANEVVAAGRTVGFGQAAGSSLTKATLAEITEAALQRTFTPEFLGRVGDTVLFEELSLTTVERIAAKKLRELAERARSRSVQLRFTPAVARWVAARGYHPDSGARELTRVIRRELEPRVSDIVLGKRTTQGSVAIVVRARRDELTFES